MVNLEIKMTNKEIAKLLRNIAAVYLLTDENRFRIIAYEKAADVIKSSLMEAKDLWQEGKLTAIPGIGASIASHLDELFRTGKVKHFDLILAKVPPSLFPLLDVPSFGPKKSLKLVKELKLKNPKTVLDDLYKAAKSGRIAGLESFGEKSQSDIIEALERFRKGQRKEIRLPLPYAYAAAERIVDYLKKNRHVIEAIFLGSLRRMRSTIGDIDIAVSTYHREDVLSWFLAYPQKERMIEKGPTGVSIVISGGYQIDLRVQSPDSFGAMLQYFTGSKEHNIHLRELAMKKGFSLSEYGIKLTDQKSKIKNQKYISKIKDQSYNKNNQLFEFQTEKAFYEAQGMSWIPPEIREDTGEIEASIRQTKGIHSGLPELIRLDDIRGDLHIHSNYNLEPSHDLGTSSIRELLKEAEELKYEYIGISDHNPSTSKHTIDRIMTIMRNRKDYIEQIKASTKSVRVKLFIMLEIDIDPKGKLALPDKAFKYIDAAIVSIHSSFRMGKKEMTDRIISGLSHPKARILAHPTGRLIEKREGYEIDWDRLFSFCREKNKALEINAFPERLDLPDVLVRQAVEKGVKLVIDTDSHAKEQMRLMKFGLSVARRGWATKRDIINTLGYNEIKSWLEDY